MIPVHLKLRNFLSYREEASLDFSSISIACLSGDNGAGKSAILDAITWAIWGKARASNDRDIISIGETEMEVTFQFQLGDQEYRVFRRRSLAGRLSQTLEFDVRDIGDGEWVPISGDSIRHTEQVIINTLNMEYETFVNSAFLLQGRADTFTQKPPGERKKILSDILNLQEYEELLEMAREERRAVDGQLSAVQGRISSLQERLATRPQLVAELDHINAQMFEVGERLDLAKELARTLAQQLEAYERVREAFEAAQARLERERAAIVSLSEQLAEREAARAKIHELLTHAEEIEHGAAEHERWRAVAAQFSATLIKVQQQIQAQNQADREIREALNELQRERERHNQALETAQKRLSQLERDEARLVELHKEAAASVDARNALEVTRATIEQLRHERSTLHAENGQLKARMNEIKDLIAAIQCGDADCPVCRRPLSADDRQHVEAAWAAEGKELGDRYRSNQQRIKDIDLSLTAVSEEEQRLDGLDRENAARTAVIEQLEAGLHDREETREKIETTEREIARVETIIRSNDFAHDARVRHEAADAALIELGYDPEQHREASDEEQRYAPYGERKRELDQARTRLEGIEYTITSFIDQRIERQKAADDASAEVERLIQQLSSDPDLQQRIDEANSDVEELSGQSSNLWAQHGGITKQLDDLDTIQLECERLEAESASLGLDSGALKELVEAFGRNGIQAMIIDSVLPELEDETNDLLRRMSSGQLRVSFRSQREALSSDRVIETLDIIIRDEYGERPYALYSGGEAFRVNFAVRVALSKLLVRRAGANVDMLVIDEGFGTQDSRGRDGLIEALRSVEPDFRKILVITHIGEIRDLFPTRIDVVKTDRGSRISVV